jgi:signal peptidase II
MPRPLPWFIVAAGIVAADQVAKWIILASFRPHEPLAVTGFFNLVLVFNKGAAFSFLRDASGWQTPLFIAFSVIASIIVTVLLLRSPGRRLLSSGLALILGGALGNLIDRLRFGHVIDFLDFHLMDWHWPVFNVADSAITVGAALLILEGFMHHERRAGAAS